MWNKLPVDLCPMIIGTARAHRTFAHRRQYSKDADHRGRAQMRGTIRSPPMRCDDGGRALLTRSILGLIFKTPWQAGSQEAIEDTCA